MTRWHIMKLPVSSPEVTESTCYMSCKSSGSARIHFEMPLVLLKRLNLRLPFKVAAEPWQSTVCTSLDILLHTEVRSIQDEDML